MPKWKKWKVTLVAQLCPTFCDPMDCHPPGSSVHGSSQARILEWIAIPFFGGSSQPRDQTQVSCVAGRFFIWATREAQTQSPIPIPCSSTREISAQTALSFSWQSIARVSALWSSFPPSSSVVAGAQWGVRELQKLHVNRLILSCVNFTGKVLGGVVVFAFVQLLSCVWLFVTPRTAACQASLSIISGSWLKLMSIESVMPSNHLVLCHPLFLLPSIFSSIRVFSNESALCIRWSKYWGFSFRISPFNYYSGSISFRFDWCDLAVQGTL